MEQQTEQLGLTVEQVSRMTSLHPQTVRALIREGRIRHVRVGRRVIVPRTEVDRFLEPQSA
jgi:excisionase family DNA binding protein